MSCVCLYHNRNCLDMSRGKMAARAAAGAGAGAGARARTGSSGIDLIGTFLSGEYQSKFIDEPPYFERLLAIADTIHDFGGGYRNKPSQDGKTEIQKFLLAEAGTGIKEGYIRQFLTEGGPPNPYQDILINSYNNIEATNREYFETQAGIDWITPITAKVKMDDIVRNDNPVDLAKSYRNNHISIELVPSGSNYISTLDSASVGKIRDFLITFLFEEPGVKCYFASDAQPMSVGKILQDSSSACGLVFPQTISDSAPTALDGKLTQLVDHYHFPSDEPDGLIFTSRANTFTKDVFNVVYQNGSNGGKNSFDIGTPYAWTQVISTVGSTPQPSATLQYSATGGKEGPSLDQLLELQVKTHNSATPPSVAPATMRQIKLSNIAGYPKIYPIIKSGIDTNTHSLYLDLKRSGDQDQCLAVSFARRDLSPNIALITGDITCAVKNRSYDNPTVEHANDRIRLYRSSKTTTPLTDRQLAQLNANTLRARAEKVEPIVKLFCSPTERAKISKYIGTIAAAIGGKDPLKARDISGYLGLLLTVPAACTTEYTPLRPELPNVTTMGLVDISAENAELTAVLVGYDTNLKQILEALTTAAAANFSAPSIEFLNWFARRCMSNESINVGETRNRPTLSSASVPSSLVNTIGGPSLGEAIPELNYDPSITLPATLPPTIRIVYDSAQPDDIIGEIDEYNSAVIKYCNTLFSTSLKDELLKQRLLKFEGVKSDILDQMRSILGNLYDISFKANLNLHELKADVAHRLFWSVSNIVLGFITVNGTHVYASEHAVDSVALGIILSEVRSKLSGKDTAIGYVLGEVGATGKVTRKRRGAPVARRSQRLAIGTRALHGGRRITLRRQRGGAACITQIDIVGELMDFFGYVAADFRTIVYTAYPLLALFIRALTIKATNGDPEELVRNIRAALPASASDDSNIDDIIAHLWNNVKDYTLKGCLESISNSLDVITETRKRQEYIELFKSNVIDVFNEKWANMIPADLGFCSNYIALLKFIWMTLTGENIQVGDDVIERYPNNTFNLDEFIILISVVYDIMLSKDKNYKSFTLLFFPQLFGRRQGGAYNFFAGGTIDLTSDEGVSRIPRFINNYQLTIIQYLPGAAADEIASVGLGEKRGRAPNIIVEDDASETPTAKRTRKDDAQPGMHLNSNIEGGAYLPHRRRRTHRRYSAQQYRKRNKSSRGRKK